MGIADTTYQRNQLIMLINQLTRQNNSKDEELGSLRKQVQELQQTNRTLEAQVQALIGHNLVDSQKRGRDSIRKVHLEVALAMTLRRSAVLWLEKHIKEPYPPWWVLAAKTLSKPLSSYTVPIDSEVVTSIDTSLGYIDEVPAKLPLEFEVEVEVDKTSIATLKETTDFVGSGAAGVVE